MPSHSLLLFFKLHANSNVGNYSSDNSINVLLLLINALLPKHSPTNHVVNIRSSCNLHNGISELALHNLPSYDDGE